MLRLSHQRIEDSFETTFHCLQPADIGSRNATKHLAVWVGRNMEYLVELAGKCNGEDVIADLPALVRPALKAA